MATVFSLFFLFLLVGRQCEWGFPLFPSIAQGWGGVPHYAQFLLLLLRSISPPPSSFMRKKIAGGIFLFSPSIFGESSNAEGKKLQHLGNCGALFYVRSFYDLFLDLGNKENKGMRGFSTLLLRLGFSRKKWKRRQLAKIY